MCIDGSTYPEYNNNELSNGMIRNDYPSNSN